MFTNERVNEILELCEKLPKGPWEWVEDKFHGGYSGLVDAENKEVLFPNCCNDGDEGAAWFEDYVTPEVRHFITLARTALPQLAEEVIKLRAVAEVAKHFYGICFDMPIDFPSAGPFVWGMGDLKDALAAAGYGGEE